MSIIGSKLNNISTVGAAQLIFIHRRVVHKLNNISTVGAPQLIFIHRRVVHKQIIYINRRSGPIDIYISEGCPLLKLIFSYEA